MAATVSARPLVESADPLVELLQVCLVSGGVVRICRGQGLLDLGRHGLGVHRVQPHVHVEFAFAMIVMLMAGCVLGTRRFAGMGIAVILVPVMVGFPRVTFARVTLISVTFFTMIMPLESAALAEFQLVEPRGFAEFDHPGSCAERIKRRVEKRLEAGPYPEYDLRGLQCGRI
ncbi:hypothetical protein ACVI1N_004372 [Sinorhizobium medicae]